MKNLKKILAVLGVVTLMASYLSPFTAYAANTNSRRNNEEACKNHVWRRTLVTNPELYIKENLKCYKWSLDELNNEIWNDGYVCKADETQEWLCTITEITWDDNTWDDNTWDDNTWDDNTWDDQPTNNWETNKTWYSGWGFHGNTTSNNDDTEEISFGWEVDLEWEVDLKNIENSEWETNNSEVDVDNSKKNNSKSELDLAYDWAVENGIIDLNTNLGKPLTRWDLADLTLNYITKSTTLQRKLSENAVYGDDNSENYQSVYKYQVMGIHADGSALDNFMPSQIATKAESVTVFDRVIHGLENNIDGANFYEKHASVLQAQWIINETINGTDHETVGGVILMMYKYEHWK